MAIGLFGFSLLGLFGLTSQKVYAATKTWDGGGADNKFSTAANWNGDAAPVNGDSLVFPVDVIFSGCSDGESNVTLNNDLDAGSITLAGITFSGNLPESCFSKLIISGNEVKTSGSIVMSGYVDVSFSVPITATADIELTSMEITGANSSLNIGAHTVTMEGSISSEGALVGTGTVVVDGFMGGRGGGGCDGTSPSYPFSGDASGFTGNIVVSGDMAISRLATSLGQAASSITVEQDGRLSFGLDFGKDLKLGTPVTFNGGEVSVNQVSGPNNCNQPTVNKTATLSGNINVTANVTVNLGNADLKFTGNLQGKDRLKLAEGQTGQIIYPDGTSQDSKLNVIDVKKVADCNQLSNLYNKNTKIVLAVDCKQSDYSKYENAENPLRIFGILAGDGGMTGYVKIMNGGAIAPGNSPGTLTVLGLTFEEGGVYDFEIEHNVSDKIVVNGPVALGNGTLNLQILGDVPPAKGTTFEIISNDGSDAVSGTFKDLPEGATFSDENEGIYKITYKGGDGNDVVVTVMQSPKTPNTGFDLLKNNPLATLVLTSTAAGAIMLIAKKQKLLISNK